MLNFLQFRQTPVPDNSFAHWALLHVSAASSGRVRRMMHHVHKLPDGSSRYETLSYYEGSPSLIGEPELVGRTDMSFDDFDSLCYELSQNFNMNLQTPTLTSNCLNWVKKIVDELEARGKLTDRQMELKPTNESVEGCLFILTLSSKSSTVLADASHVRSS
jgi:hypothetical protein